MNFAIIIHTGALVFTIKRYTGAKLLNGLAERVVFNQKRGLMSVGVLLLRSRVYVMAFLLVIPMFV